MYQQPPVSAAHSVEDNALIRSRVTETDSEWWESVVSSGYLWSEAVEDVTPIKNLSAPTSRVDMRPRNNRGNPRNNIELQRIIEHRIVDWAASVAGGAEDGFLKTEQIARSDIPVNQSG